MIQRYRHKPTEIEAVQVTDANLNEVAQWCGGVVRRQPAGYISDVVFRVPFLGSTQVGVGQWLVRDGDEFEAWKPEDFATTYDLFTLAEEASR